VQLYFKEGKALGLIFVFILFALLSMFFNFNSIYGNSTKDTLLSKDAKGISLKLTSQRINAIEAIQTYFKIADYQYKYDSLKLAEKREVEDRYRPGHGEIWREISQQIPAVEASLREAKRRCVPYIAKIDTIYHLCQMRVEGKEAVTINDIETAIQGYNNIGVIVQSIIPSYHFSRESFTNNSGEPDFALITLGRFFSGDSSLTEKEKSLVKISLFTSFLLDFPIFFAIVLLNWKKSRRRRFINDIFNDDDPDTNSNNKKGKNKGKINWD